MRKVEMAETARVVPLRAEAQPHRVTVLGGFRVTAPDGSDATPRAKKTRALLAFLLMTRKAWSRERLAYLCWMDRADEQAKASLRQALYELRDLASGPNPLLVVKRDEVAAAPAAVLLDIDEIEGLAREGEIAALAEALSRARLQLLSDLDGAGRDFDEWLTWEQHETKERLLAASVEAGEAALAAGRFAEVRKLADALEGVDGLNEPAARLGLAADRGVGDLSALRRRYDRFAKRLKAELDAAPAPETTALLQTGPTPAAGSVDARAPTTASPPSGATLSRRALWPWLAAAAVALLLVVAGALGWSRFSAPAGAASVAVLPFRGGEGYYGAGVSEAVHDLLARDPELRVVGSASARLFGAGSDPVATARRLGVTHLLDGEARRAGTRMDIRARLTRVRDGRVVWSARFQRPAEDVFGVQTEIAAAAAQVLGARIAPRNNPHLVTRPEVYDRYLQARGLARERRNPAIQEARRLLKEAVALDPDYAPAFASLAQVTMLLANHPTSYGDIPIPEAQTEARRYAQRAIQLAPELGEAYAAYGLISLSDSQSLAFYERAVALDPQRPDFHRWLGQAYSDVGREADALREYQRAAALDPLMWLSASHLVGQLSFLGRSQEAREAAQRFARLSNDRFGTARVLAGLAENEGRLADYVRLTEAAVQQWPGERSLAGDLARAWASLGERDRGLAVLSPKETVARLSLMGDADGLAREARRLGRSFWDSEPGYWAFAETLARGGQGAVLLELFDAEFGSVQAFGERAPMKALASGVALIAAFQDAGRDAEARALADMMWKRIDSDVRAGMAPAHAAYDRAAILALTGRRDEALAQLEAAVKANWVDMTWLPDRRLDERVAFRGLRGDPRLARIQADLEARVNAERAKLGLAPIRN